MQQAQQPREPPGVGERLGGAHRASAGHPGEVGAGAERAAAAGEHDRAHGVVVDRALHGVGDLVDQHVVHRVAQFGSVEPDERDALGQLGLDRGVGHRCVFLLACIRLSVRMVRHGGAGGARRGLGARPEVAVRFADFPRFLRKPLIRQLLELAGASSSPRRALRPGAEPAPRAARPTAPDHRRGRVRSTENAGRDCLRSMEGTGRRLGSPDRVAGHPSESDDGISWGTCHAWDDAARWSSRHAAPAWRDCARSATGSATLEVKVLWRGEGRTRRRRVGRAERTRKRPPAQGAGGSAASEGSEGTPRSGARPPRRRRVRPLSPSSEVKEPTHRPNESHPEHAEPRLRDRRVEARRQGQRQHRRVSAGAMMPSSHSRAVA